MIFLHRLIIALVLYCLVVLAILAVRPSLMFDAQGRPKPFGLGFADGYSVFSPAVALPVLAVMCFIVVTVATFAM